MEIKFWLCVFVCVGVGEGVKEPPPQPPLPSTLQGKPPSAPVLTNSYSPSPLPRNRVGSAGQVTQKMSLQTRDVGGEDEWTEPEACILSCPPHPVALASCTPFLNPGFLLCRMRALDEISSPSWSPPWSSSTKPKNT